MEYRKNPETLQIIGLDKFGKEFDNWEVPTVLEILEMFKNEKIAQCQAYLNSTDKWSIRLSETSVAMPSGVATNRANARAYQGQIEACTTTEQLNNINTDF